MAGKALFYLIYLVLPGISQVVKPAASADDLGEYCMRQSIIWTESLFRLEPLILGIDAR